MYRSLAITLVLACACHGEPDELTRGPLAVTATSLRIAGGGEQPEPLDLSTLEAFGFDGDRAVPLAIAIEGAGAVVDRAVPGPAYLRFDDIWFVTDGDGIELGEVVLGRAEVQSAAVSLSLAVDQLDPWRDGDQLQLYSAAASLWLLTGVAGVESGATSLDLDLDYQGPLAAAGDQLWVAQLTERAVGDDPYQALVRAQPVSADMTASEPRIEASLTPAPQARFTLDWDIRAFDDVRLADQPVIAQSWYDANLAVLDRAGDYGFYGLAADLVTMRVTDQTGRNIDGELVYGNPFPGGWTAMATFIAWYPVAVRAAEADLPVTVFDNVWVRDRAASLDGAGIAPVLGPPRELEVRGGGAPSVSWTAPALGTPTLYELTVINLRSVAGRTEVISEARVLTELTDLRLPPGAVDPGAEGFVVRVAAIRGPIGHARSPRAQSLPYAVASMTSGLASP